MQGLERRRAQVLRRGGDRSRSRGDEAARRGDTAAAERGGAGLAQAALGVSGMVRGREEKSVGLGLERGEMLSGRT
jgi:hypothetical protein